MTFIAALVAALKVIAVITMTLSFLAWAFLTVCCFACSIDSKYRPLMIILGIISIFLWLTMVIFCMDNSEKWFQYDWFNLEKPKTEMIAE